MRKLLISTALTCILLSGCNNTVNENANNIKQPVEASMTEDETAKTKEEYIQKLNTVEKNLSDLQHLQDEGTTVSMSKAAEETYIRWDNALNEIYGELKLQLSTSDRAKLKEEQLIWITFRDETAENAASEYKGGSMESLQYISSLSQVTKERCYELVEQYMNI